MHLYTTECLSRYWSYTVLVVFKKLDYVHYTTMLQYLAESKISLMCQYKIWLHWSYANGALNLQNGEVDVVLRILLFFLKNQHTTSFVCLSPFFFLFIY